MRFYNPTHDEIIVAYNFFAKQILAYFDGPPDYIIGLQRGGLIPATHLSHMLHTPLRIADYSHPNSVGDNKDTHNLIIPTFDEHVKKLVISEDIIDTGYVLHGFMDTLQVPDDCKVLIVTLFNKQGNIFEKADRYDTITWRVIPQDAPFVNFPWEKSYE